MKAAWSVSVLKCELQFGWLKRSILIWGEALQSNVWQKKQQNVSNICKIESSVWYLVREGEAGRGSVNSLGVFWDMIIALCLLSIALVTAGLYGHCPLASPMHEILLFPGSDRWESRRGPCGRVRAALRREWQSEQRRRCCPRRRRGQRTLLSHPGCLLRGGTFEKKKCNGSQELSKL